MSTVFTLAHIVWLNMIRRKDVYVLIILMSVSLLVLVSLNVLGLGGTTAYVKDVGLLFAWIFAWIIGVISSTREIPGEEERRTVFTMLSKPINRFEYIAGKWLGSWLATSAAATAFYVMIVGITYLKQGSFNAASLLQALFLHIILLGVVCSIGTAFSTRMNHDAAATMSFVLTTVSFLVVPRVPEFIAKEEGFKSGILLLVYNVFPHFEVFDLRRRIVHDYGPVDLQPMLAVAGYGIALVALFLFAAWLSYRSKMFVRDRLG